MQSTPASRVAHSGRLRRLAGALHTTMARYGYTRVETPVIQPADLFLTKAGDQIVSRLFTFERNGQQFALRPEFTATAARDYVLDAANDGKVVRWQFSGPIFEDDTAQPNNVQQFSVGAELINLGGPLAEAEIMSMALDGVSAHGIDDWRLVIGHVGLMRLLLSRFNLDPRTARFLLAHLNPLRDPALGKASVLHELDKLVQGRDSSAPEIGSFAAAEIDAGHILDALLDATQRNVTMGGRTRHDITRRLLQKRQRATDYAHIMRALDFLAEWAQISAPPEEAFAAIRAMIEPDDAEALALLDEWARVLDLLDACAIPAERIHIQPALARNWDYYTGLVFEIYAGDYHLAGGGRYDELISLVGGKRDVPAVGFVYYPDALLTATTSDETSADSRIILAVADDMQAAGMRWAHALRRRGLNVVVQPLDPPDNSTAPRVSLESARVARWAGSTYNDDQLDTLAADLKRV